MEKNKVILITGTAGFIGFHTAKLFLKNDWTVVGIINKIITMLT